MNQNSSLKVLLVMCVGITMLGVIFSNESVVNYFNNHPFLNYFLVGAVLISGIAGALIFIKERTGQPFSLYMLITAILIAVVLIDLEF
jgi:hypothetical protein